MLSLVVEDDAGLRQIYELVLKRMDFDVHLVEDGEQAIQYLQEHVPDIIFLDMLLPRRNGIEVLQFMLDSKNPKLKSVLVVVVTSNRHFETEIPEGLSVHFMVKPIRPEQIRHFASMAIKT